MSKVVSIQCAGSRTVDISQLEEFQGSLKSLSEADFQRLKTQIVETGFAFPVYVWTSPEGAQKLIGGHQRLRVLRWLRENGWTVPAIPVVDVKAETEQDAKHRVLQDVSQYGSVEKQGLYEFAHDAMIDIEKLQLDFSIPELKMDLGAFAVGFGAERLPTMGSADSLSSPLGGEPVGNFSNEPRPTLADRFLVPPFSVLDTRQGYWQSRKRKWLELGIQSEVGRKENLLGMSNTMLEPDPEKRAKMVVGDYDGGNAFSGGGTSIFDPVLCELAYRWFSPKGSVVLDPFAGGSVRGIIASKLNRHYIGVELRPEQVEANRSQAENLCEDPMPIWHNGDSANIDAICAGVEADFLFSCPPYADLEVYSDLPGDISNMEYEDFARSYRSIITKAASLLKKDRFACFVVGEVREKKGNGRYKGFVQLTIDAFEEAGLQYYNEGILVTSVGTLALRAGGMFTNSRKLGKCHQNVLVFVKGNAKKATEACGEVELVDLEVLGAQEQEKQDAFAQGPQ